MEKWNQHPLLMGLQNNIVTLKSSLKIPQNVKQSYYITQEFHSWQFYPGLPKSYVHTKVYVNVHGSIIHNSPKVKYKCPFTDDYIKEYIRTM